MSDLPRVYRSTDPGAPQLSGQAGAFVAIMDAVLVDGYGAGPDAKAPLGWTRAYTGTNKRSFRNDPALYSGNYIRFDDSNAQFVLVDGYEAMTTVDAGSERFEETSSGWAKSNAASSAARAWVVVGTARCFYIFMSFTNALPYGFFVGDLITLGPADIWRFAYTRTGTSAYAARSGMFRADVSTSWGVRIARTGAGIVGGETLFNRQSLFAQAQFYGQQGYSYPLATTDGALLSRAILNINAVNTGAPPRAVMPGVWIAEHVGAHSNNTIYGDFPGLPPGTQLLAMYSIATTSPTNTYGLLDITNAWE